MHNSKASKTTSFTAHAGFLRRLAQNLVADEHDCEDLVQEAWTTFAEKSGKGFRPKNLRAWFSRVLSNQARNLHRDRAHRTDREQLVVSERSREAKTASELGVQERVLAAVSELKEPYRSAVYMRYYQDMTPSAIAKELDVPLATVDSRLLRGRALIRQRLTSELGENRIWIAALIPLCPSNPFPPPVTLPVGPISGAGALGMKLVITAALSVTAIAAAYLIGPLGEQAAVPNEVAQVSAPITFASESPGPVVEPDVLSISRARKEIGSKRAENKAAKASVQNEATTEQLNLKGIALDVAAYPVPSLSLRFDAKGATALDEPTATAETDASGRFEFEGLEGPGRVNVNALNWTTVIEGALPDNSLPEEQLETIVVVAPACELSVLVEDENGNPVEGALVEVVLPNSLETHPEFRFEHSALVQIEEPTNEDGKFEATVAQIEGVQLRVSKASFETLLYPLELETLAAGSRHELTLALLHLKGRPDSFAGQVVDLYGQGVANACVELGRSGTRADENGRFVFDLAERDPFKSWNRDIPIPRQIIAAHAGWQPVTVAIESDAEGLPIWPENLVLQLAEPALSISGKVIDQDGLPVAGAVVFVTTAHLIAGVTTIEAEMRGQSVEDDFLMREYSDERGRFEFSGLLDKPYTIAAFVERVLVRGQMEDVPAGTAGIEIAIDRNKVWPKISGRVLNRKGDPLAGVKVTPEMQTQRAFGSTGDWYVSEDMESVTTNEQGEYELLAVPKSFVSLTLQHPELLYTSGVELPTAGASEDADGNLEYCDLTAGLRMRLRVELDHPEEADEFRIRDADGNEIEILAQSANRYFSSPDNRILTEGKSRHHFVDEDAVLLVLIRGGQEIRRVPLNLKWLEETVIR